MIRLMTTLLLFISVMTTLGDHYHVLEEHIPFDIRITEQPSRYCQPMDLRVEIESDDKARWFVMDGEKVQFEFEYFDDLYYQCDGPGCFMIGFKDSADNRRWHVCLK